MHIDVVHVYGRINSSKMLGRQWYGYICMGTSMIIYLAKFWNIIIMDKILTLEKIRNTWVTSIYFNENSICQ